MSLKDVKKYYYDVQAQVIAAKEDLQDLNEAAEAGQITDDKLAAIVDEINLMQVNYDRLTYIMYLFDLPNRPKKKKRFKQITSNKAVEDELERRNSTSEQVITENTNALARIRQEIKELKASLKK